MGQEIVRQHGRVGFDFDELDGDRRYLADHDTPQGVGDGGVCARQHELRREFRAGTHRDNRMPLHGCSVLFRADVVPSNRIFSVYGELYVALTVLIPFKQTVIKQWRWMSHLLFLSFLGVCTQYDREFTSD